VAVTALSSAPAKLKPPGFVSINVTAANLGTFPESFWLFVKASNTSASNVAVQFLSLAAGQSMPISINWNTSGMRPAKYQMFAIIILSQTENEIVTGDNTRLGGQVWLIPPGDVDWDGSVTIQDLAIIAVAYNSTPGSPNWNPQADLNGDGKVNLGDLALCAFWYHTYT
jgi:hypothetical protein